MAVSERALAVVGLILRVFTLLILAASLATIAMDKIYGPYKNVVEPPNLTFLDYYAFRYVFSVAVIGCAYTFLVIPFAAIRVSQRKRSRRIGATLFLIFTDVVLAVLIATGAAAGLGLSAEYQRYIEHDGLDFDNFYVLVDVSCGLMLAAVVCMVATIMISVHSLS